MGKEQAPRPESAEDLHQKLIAAHEEENQILKEIDGVFAATPDRKEAEKIILEKYASRMDQAVKRYSEATEQWLEAIRREASEERE